MQSAPWLKQSVVHINSLWDLQRSPWCRITAAWDFQLQTPFQNLGDPDETVKSGKEFALEENGFMKPFKYLRIRAIKCMIYDF